MSPDLRRLEAAERALRAYHRAPGLRVSGGNTVLRRREADDIYLSTEQSYTAVCATPQAGELTITVRAGAHRSRRSQAHADAQALADAQAQAEAGLVCWLPGPLRALPDTSFEHPGGACEVFLNDAWQEFGERAWYDDNSGGPLVWRLETCAGASVGTVSIGMSAADSFDDAAGRPRHHSFGELPAGIYRIRHIGGTWRTGPGQAMIVWDEGVYTGTSFYRGTMLARARAAACP